MAYLIQYWKELVVALIVGLLTWYIGSLRLDKEKLCTKNIRLQAYIELQNALLESNKVEYEAKLKEFSKVREVNRMVYKDKIKEIYTYLPGETNATCNDVIAKFDSYQY